MFCKVRGTLTFDHQNLSRQVVSTVSRKLREGAVEIEKPKEARVNVKMDVEDGMEGVDSSYLSMLILNW